MTHSSKSRRKKRRYKKKPKQIPVFIAGVLPAVRIAVFDQRFPDEGHYGRQIVNELTDGRSFETKIHHRHIGARVWIIVRSSGFLPYDCEATIERFGLLHAVRLEIDTAYNGNNREVPPEDWDCNNEYQRALAKVNERRRKSGRDPGVVHELSATMNAAPAVSASLRNDGDMPPAQFVKVPPMAAGTAVVPPGEGGLPTPTMQAEGHVGRRIVELILDAKTRVDRKPGKISGTIKYRPSAGWTLAHVREAIRRLGWELTSDEREFVAPASVASASIKSRVNPTIVDQIVQSARDRDKSAVG